MGKPKKKRIDIAESGVLSDLAFLLIIFFIVIAVFNVNMGFVLGLPKKDSKRLVNVKDIIKVELNEDGSISAAGEIYSLDQLKEEISAALIPQPNLTFLLNIHPDVTYQAVIEIIELVRQLEVDNFSFTLINLPEEGL